MWKFLNHTLWSFVGIVVGAALTLIFFRLGQKRKRLVTWTRKYTILDKRVATLKGVQVRFEGVEIARLIEYRIAVWNAGNDVLKEADFPSMKRLMVAVSEPEHVVGINVLGSSADANNVRVSWTHGERESRVNLEYLEGGEGLVLSVLCNDDLTSLPVVNGQVMGGGKVRPFIRSKPPGVIVGVLMLAVLLNEFAGLTQIAAKYVAPPDVAAREEMTNKMLKGEISISRLAIYDLLQLSSLLTIALFLAAMASLLWWAIGKSDAPPLLSSKLGKLLGDNPRDAP